MIPVNENNVSSTVPVDPEGLPDGSPSGADPKTLELLVCPLTKATLEYDSVRQELISRRANLAYPIRSGVPLLTRDAARNLDDPVRGFTTRIVRQAQNGTPDDTADTPTGK